MDAGAPNRRRVREEKELKSSNFVKPSNGLEPLTPSLPCLRDSCAVRFKSFCPLTPGDLDHPSGCVDVNAIKPAGFHLARAYTGTNAARD